jgi:hypothetical protein
LPEASVPRVSDTGRPSTVSPSRPSPETALTISDSPETDLRCCLPFVRSRPPMTSPTSSRLPNRTGQEWPGSNHHAHHCNKYGEELLTTMLPMTALYARFVRAWSMEPLLWTSIPTIRIRSRRISRPRGLDPLRQVKLQGPIRHAGYRTRHDGVRRYNTERQEPLPQQWHACLTM